MSEVDKDMKHQRTSSQEKYPISVQRIKKIGLNDEVVSEKLLMRTRSKSIVVREMDESVLQLLTWEVDWSSLPPYAAKHFAVARSIFIETLISTELKKACTLYKVISSNTLYYTKYTDFSTELTRTKFNVDYFIR